MKLFEYSFAVMKVFIHVHACMCLTFPPNFFSCLCYLNLKKLWILCDLSAALFQLTHSFILMMSLFNFYTDIGLIGLSDTSISE